MATVNYKRIVDGTSISGKYGESLQIAEKWIVRVDSPDTPKSDILGLLSSGGVYFGSAHPEFSACKAMEFSCSPTGKDGMLWVVEVKYYIPPLGKQIQSNGVPKDVWEMTGSTTTVPVFEDVSTPPKAIVNSAGDPLEGLERERPAQGYTLTKFYTSENDLFAAFLACFNKVNSGTWAGGAAKTWKCDFKSATPRSISKFDGDDDGGLLHFIESKWEFRYEASTWKCMPWDIGFMELDSGQRKTILGSDGKAVKQPVALNTDGTKKTPGEPPDVINGGAGVDIYLTANFSTYFGTPALLPAP